MAAPGQSGFPSRLAHYEITGELGQGGMGTVYKAIDTKLGRPVALKVISRHAITDDDRRRFAREANAASTLNHPNIVTIHAYDSVNGLDFIAMELIDGETLDHRLSHPSTPISLDILRQVAVALTAAHAAGIVHRDLKPANIMITPSGLVKVLDFGLAKREVLAGDNTQSALTQAGAVVGTPAYMSPEQALGEHTDWRTDIFSFGVILYEAVCGQRPFQGRNVMAILHAVANTPHPPPANATPALAALIERCLVKDRALRLQSIAEAIPLLTPDSVITRAPRRARRFILPLLALALLIAAFAGRHSIRSWLTVNAPSVVSPTAYGHYQRASQFLLNSHRKGHTDLAIAEFQKAIAQDPAFAPAFAGLSEAYVGKNLAFPDPNWLRLARQSAETAVALNPHLAVTHLAVARACLAQRDLIRATSSLARALELDPLRADTHRTLGALRRAQNDFPAAEEAFKAAIRLDPANWLSASELGSLYFANTRFAEAASTWQAASAKVPDNDILHRNLGAALHMLGQHEHAAVEFQKALEIAPSATTFNNLGTIRYFQGRYDDSIGAFEKAVDGRPNAYAFWGNLADAYRWGTGTRSRAAAAYTRAVQLARAEPKAADPDIRSRVALYLAKLGDPAAARAELAALPAANLAGAVWFRVAVARDLIHDRDLALAALDRAIAAGYSRAEIESEPELAPLRSDRRYHMRMANMDTSAYAAR